MHTARGLSETRALSPSLSLSPREKLQDHPDDRAWFKYVYDFVAPSGALKYKQVPTLLSYFYRNRVEGPTTSGFTLSKFPEHEQKFIEDLYPKGAEEPDATIEFPILMDALMAAQANFSAPSAPVEYNSNFVMRNDRVKHTRNVLNPQQSFRKPMTTSQEVGWELETAIGEPEPPSRHPFHLRTSATTQFADAMEKMTWGRSIAGEFSAYACAKLAAFGGMGMGV